MTGWCPQCGSPAGRGRIPGGKIVWDCLRGCGWNGEAVKDKPLTVAEAAAKLGVSAQLVTKLIRANRLKAHREPGSGHGRFWIEAKSVHDYQERRANGKTN